MATSTLSNKHYQVRITTLGKDTYFALVTEYDVSAEKFFIVESHKPVPPEVYAVFTKNNIERHSNGAFTGMDRQTTENIMVDLLSLEGWEFEPMTH